MTSYARGSSFCFPSRTAPIDAFDNFTVIEGDLRVTGQMEKLAREAVHQGYLAAISAMIVSARLFMRIGDRVKGGAESAGD